MTLATNRHRKKREEKLSQLSSLHCVRPDTQLQAPLRTELGSIVVEPPATREAGWKNLSHPMAGQPTTSKRNRNPSLAVDDNTA